MKKKILILLGSVVLIILIFNFDVIQYVLATIFGDAPCSSFFSDSKDEAKHRGAYVCDIKPININIEGVLIQSKNGWLEKGWHGNSKITHLDSKSYTVNLSSPGKGEEINKMIIYSPFYDSYFYYNTSSFISIIYVFPNQDSIKYYAFKENRDGYNYKDFSKNHIVDSFYVILDRKH